MNEIINLIGQTNAPTAVLIVIATLLLKKEINFSFKRKNGEKEIEFTFSTKEKE
ncbi:MULTISPECIES: hypothetical protein [Bacillus]|uniref:hypothetical protein n=1 Tax=Bacillus TaxID=1386 RepID=UPI001586D3BF|nr:MULTISPECIES: hypothetical protein [Bacillus]